MASFDHHFQQALHNLEFLKSIANQDSKFWDWKVTVSFYIAVHIMNAHLDRSVQKHYRKHSEVSVALNPKRNTASAVPSDVYISYEKLSSLSRRSRYLINEDLSNISTNRCLTYDVHLGKALRSLEKIEQWFSNTYNVEFPKVPLFCLEVKNNQFFEHEHLV